MALSKKQMLISGGVLLAGAGFFLIFRKKNIEYYSTIWCNEGCQNIEDEYGGVQGYIANKGVKTEDLRTEGENTGYVNLLFAEPHNLKVGEQIYIQQSEDAAYPSYDGGTVVNKVQNTHIIEVPIARIGGSGIEGGVVTSSSIWNKYSPF